MFSSGQQTHKLHQTGQQQQHQQEKVVDEKKSCIVKRRIKKEPLDIIMAMPPSFCIQVEEVKSKSNRRRRNSWAGGPMPCEKKPIVMFPNPTFDRSSNGECDLNKTEKKVSKIQEKVVRLGPCHTSSSNSVGKLKVNQKDSNSGRFMHPIRDSLKRTSAFMKAFSSKEK